MEKELDQQVAQRTAELAAANEDLRREVAERRRAEEALRHSEARLADGERDLQLTIDTIPVFVATYRPDGTRSFVNRTWQEYMGLTLEEATGAGAKTFPHFHPDDAERNDRAWRAALESGKPLLIEVRVRRADGQYRWHTSHRVPLRDESGDIVKWYSVGIDIEDQKVAEDALRLSEARLAETERELRKIINTIPALAWSARPDGTAEFFNQHYLDYVGLSLEQVQDRGWTVAVHPDDLNGLAGTLQRTMASGQPGEAEARLRRHDGEYRWFLFRVNPLRDDAGNIIKWYGTNIDIEDRKRADEALRREVTERTRAEQLARIDEARFRRFFDLPLIGMAVTSPERRFLEVNEKLCQILGYPREELIGRDWASITHPDDLSGNLGLLGEAMAGATESYSMDKRYIHRDGQIVYASISVCCVRRTDGTPDHFVLTVQDVTARRQVQEQLERTEAHLRHGQQIARLASYEVYPPGLGDVRWSEELYNMLGLEPGSLVPQMAEYIERFVHPDDREYMREAALRCANVDHRFVMEYRIVRPDGTLRHMQSITDPVKDEGGRIVKLVGTLLDTTERKRVEQALRESEERFALAVAGSNVGIFDWDLATDQLFLSVRAQELCGIEPGEPWRRRHEWSTIFRPLPDDLDTNRRALRAHLAGETPACDVEYRLMLESGDCRWFRHRGLALRDATGKAYRMAGSIEDITERKRVEEAQTRHARHVALRADVHAAFSHAADPLQEVLRRGAEAIVRNARGALARIWTLDQDMGVLELRASAGLYTHLDGAHSRIPFGHLMIGKIAQDRTPHLTNDVLNDPGIGDREWVQKQAIVAFVGVPLLIEGRVAGVVAMFAQQPLESDTVEAFEAIADTIAQGIGRRRAEEALRESEQRFRDYAEAASDWLWETGPDHRFTWFALRNTRVHQPDNRIGRTRWEIAAEVDEEPEKWRRHIATLDAHEPFRGFTYRTVQGDGSIAYLAVSGKPVFDAQGGFQGYRGAASDVTAAVRADQAEKALHQAQAELAHVARVTSLGALTASIAHEVNQPLSGIITNASTCLRMLAADPPNVDGARETTRRTLRDGNRASEVITRLRTLFSKKDAVMDSVDLNEAAREVMAMSLSELERGRLVARLELADELPPVAGDRVQLQQVILNLLLNAADAMSGVEDRPRQVLIRTERDEGGRVRLSVQDVGVGLDPQSMDRLFEAFYTTKPNGMGIGLSVSRSIIERHHGRLWAAANDGPGATFSFSIPHTVEGVTDANSLGVIPKPAATNEQYVRGNR